MKPTREQIEAKWQELNNNRDEQNFKAFARMGDNRVHFYRYSMTTLCAKFIDFLSGDDKRERWECPNTTCSRKCVMLQTKGMTKPIFCNQINQVISWKKVGAE